MKYTGQDGDPYLDKGTGILRNLLGIQDQAALDKAESSLSFLQAAKLREQPVAGKFDWSPTLATTSTGRALARLK